MKLLITRAVDFVDYQGHDFLKETSQFNFSNVCFLHIKHHKQSAIKFHDIQKRADTLYGRYLLNMHVCFWG